MLGCWRRNWPFKHSMDLVVSEGSHLGVAACLRKLHLPSCSPFTLQCRIQLFCRLRIPTERCQASAAQTAELGATHCGREANLSGKFQAPNKGSNCRRGPAYYIVGAPRLPLLLPPFRQQLHRLGICLLEDPQILLNNDVHLAVVPRVDEMLRLDVLWLIPLHHRATHFCHHSESVQLQVALARILQPRVQAVPTTLDLCERVLAALLALTLPVLCRVFASLFAGAASAHHAHMLQGVQRVLHICWRRGHRGDHDCPVLVVCEALLEQMRQAGSPEGYVLQLVFPSLVSPLPVPVHDARTLLEHEEREVDVATSLGHLPRMHLCLEVALRAR
mmetsp:Transcript_6053/g.14903  ORF Transcript_6053/g.14903 Transcript_6053/m.14903 type:complete len:332 (-) Transcript_6053:257-1252(-)